VAAGTGGGAVKEWRTAVVGAGLMGTWHGVYARRAGARVVAVVDREASLARALARRLGARAYGQDEDWLASSGVEVVHICTPLSSHGALAAKSLEAGCHVVVEKPLALTLEEARSLLALARAQERRIIAVHQMPFQRGVRHLLSRRADLGDLVRVEHRACTAGAEGRPRAERRAVLHGILSHSLSLFHALGLGVEDVGRWRVLRDGADELELAMASGCTQLAVLLSTAARPTVHELTVWGTKGAARADLFHGFCIFEPGGVSRANKILRPFRLAARLLGAASLNLGVRALARQTAYPGLPELFTAFYECLENDGLPPVTEEEILEAAALQQRLVTETPRR